MTLLPIKDAVTGTSVVQDIPAIVEKEEVDEGGSPLSFLSEGWFDFISFENIIKLMALLVIIGLVAVIILKGNLVYRLKMLRMKSFKDLF